MKVLVCGGRDFNDWNLLYETLDTQLAAFASELEWHALIHGEATGADTMAGCWAHEHGIQEIRCPANWEYHGKKAGVIRNGVMAYLKPDLVIAFPGGKGTGHMIKISREHGIPVTEISPRP